LTTRGPDAPVSSYCDGIQAGAAQRAEELGYSFSTLQIGQTRDSWRTLPRILRSRGVEGVVLLPMLTPAKFVGLLDWRDFSVVSTTSSVLTPRLHSVLPHHFRNSQMAAEHLHTLGYRRVGVVINFPQTQRLNHALTAAIAWHGLLHEGYCVPPLIYSGPTPLGLEAWFRREQPDVIVTHLQRLCREFSNRLDLPVPGPVGFVSANTVPEGDFAGINECPAEIGSTAIDLLAGMVQRGVRGIPTTPTTTQVAGHWLDGPSCSRRRKVSRRIASPAGSPAVYLEK
jgi:DNA-binding LacI/PurR family transcriptional regulator